MLCWGPCLSQTRVLLLLYLQPATFAHTRKEKKKTLQRLTQLSRMFPNSVVVLVVLYQCGLTEAMYLRNAVTDPARLWPNGKIPYTFHPGIDAYRKVHVLSGMKQVMLSTYADGNPCITFVPRTNENDYITFQFVDAGSPGTKIGRAGGQQIVSIQHEITQSNIAQALMFVIGVYPEVSLATRDNFLDVDMNNINAAEMKNFVIRNATDNFQQPFDYETVAMYLPYFAAINKSLPTIKTKYPGYTIGQSISLSNGDINLVQHAYNCPLDASHRVDVLGPLLLECHFHEDMCQLMQGTDNNFDWQFMTGPTGNVGTGPMADHSSGSGGYAIAQSSSHYSQIAKLVAPTLPPGTYCVVLWIHAYGADVGQLRVIQTNNDGDKVIFGASAQPVSQWYHGSGTIVSPNSPVTVTIEAFMGSGPQGDIAIDDVYIYNGKCIDWY